MPRSIPVTLGLLLATALFFACSDDAPPAPESSASQPPELMPATPPPAAAQAGTGAPLSEPTPEPEEEDLETRTLRRNKAMMNFFVASDKSPTGNLGGLKGADARCQRIGESIGHGHRSWRAFLSVEHDPDNDNKPLHARDRIGTGPWYTARGEEIAPTIELLFERPGSPTMFVDEHGQPIPGEWRGSPTPPEHDILTGSTPSGHLIPGRTCKDWTSDSPLDKAQVGHSDGLGPGNDRNPPYNQWISLHANESCADTAPLGGAGHIYCFAP